MFLYDESVPKEVRPQLEWLYTRATKAKLPIKELVTRKPGSDLYSRKLLPEDKITYVFILLDTGDVHVTVLEAPAAALNKKVDHD